MPLDLIVVLRVPDRIRLITLYCGEIVSDERFPAASIAYVTPAHGSTAAKIAACFWCFASTSSAITRHCKRERTSPRVQMGVRLWRLAGDPD